METAKNEIMVQFWEYGHFVKSYTCVDKREYLTRLYITKSRAVNSLIKKLKYAGVHGTVIYNDKCEISQVI